VFYFLSGEDSDLSKYERHKASQPIALKLTADSRRFMITPFMGTGTESLIAANKVSIPLPDENDCVIILLA
jgi:hypothetical protein